ncbi:MULTISPECIES: DUF3630 family protein [Pseudoalteromonas]|jgi:hypothetical protein|uniref:DUF3630 family protein n=1 Tax=Pseudoalteromonas TaxID=53246 RepID=UPI00057F8A15|nr:MULTISPECIES: DUF3630 family protein [Pseudoalteromonas]KID37436.1 hypothetical protein QT15_07040 [Pseudoalteromonas flavipulchra NCIMB 2033 = ATCC BAA-314]MBD0783805.1 DUF3630 family protein [Pseudoalteromonas flavipulchra]MBE0374215.1 hypothetical protein [Pseudoalteromonas flavipulchra NCIMB 2033 = ATCC BAA-314]MBR8845874.1 DUF3630 family protein [Pseudoalteromonas sp. JC3]MCF2827318.1 DUF3630 family protein [Pseudoalteromonas sp. OF5H-5]
MTTLTLDNSHEVIIVSCEITPQDDEFELWGQIFLHQDEIQLIEFSAGADRHQWRFSYKSCNFNLNFEHYSESVWIAPDGVDALELLPFLRQQLSR